MSIYFQRTWQRAFGTFPLRGDELASAIESALTAGYRAFDTAQMYGNEAELGAVLAASPIPRDELFITTKVHPDNFGAANFIRSVEQSLKDLQIDRADVLLLHWPGIGGDNREALGLLDQAAARGLTQHIGISNYTAQMMRDASSILEHPAVTNQVEFHPLLDQRVLLAAAAETGIPLSSYCSVARGKVFDQPLFTEIAQRYEKKPGQIVLRWILQTGVSINTMSRKPQNMASNFDVMDFSLSSVDMAAIDALANNGVRIVDKPQVPWAPDWD